MLNFFSVARDPPDRFAAFNAALPRTTVSRCEAPPRALLPILVTESHSSDIVCELLEVIEIVSVQFYDSGWIGESLVLFVLAVALLAMSWLLEIALLVVLRSLKKGKMATKVARWKTMI